MAKSAAQSRGDADDVRTKEREEVLSDLKNMVNNPETSDVIFRCNDGIPVHACRLLLANRCAVFNRMLSNGMLETKLSEIPLVNFSSSVVLSVVEYLYTGTVDTYPPVNWRMAFEMISAAQFFNVPRLETIAQEFLQSQVSSLDGLSPAPVLMDKLSVAVEFQETWQGKDPMLRDLIGHIGDYWCDEDIGQKLSTSAVDYILSSSKRDCDQGENEPYMEEYVMFRKIVLWLIHPFADLQNIDVVTQVQKFLPGRDSYYLKWHEMLKAPVDISAYVTDTLVSNDSFDPTAVLNTFVGGSICKDSLEQLLRHVNLLRMPAELLVKVIHPLRIFPPQQILEALVHQAIHRRVQYSESGFNWMHGPSLRTSNDGHVFFNGQAEARGVAIAFIQPPRSSHVHEWSFEILQDDGFYIELGFFCQPHNQVFRDNQMLEKNLWLISPTMTRILCVNKPDENTCVSRKDPQQFWGGWECFKTEVKVKSTVHFRLNETERTCRVKFGNSSEAVWEELPEGDYFPAVGFFKCKCVAVRLRLASGFNYF